MVNLFIQKSVQIGYFYIGLGMSFLVIPNKTWLTFVHNEVNMVHISPNLEDMCTLPFITFELCINNLYGSRLQEKSFPLIHIVYQDCTVC